MFFCVCYYLNLYLFIVYLSCFVSSVGVVFFLLFFFPSLLFPFFFVCLFVALWTLKFSPFSSAHLSSFHAWSSSGGHCEDGVMLRVQAWPAYLVVDTELIPLCACGMTDVK